MSIPAFPVPIVIDHDQVVSAQAYGFDCGMSLRDYFAGQALTALLSQMFCPSDGVAMYDPNDPAQAGTLAHLSYQAADAMLIAREAKP